MAADRNAIVFDTEPLIAHADDEPGAAVTSEYLDSISTGEIEGYLTRINATELRYVLARKYDTVLADRYLRWLEGVGVAPLGAAELWRDAADWILDANPSLADAYALAGAEVTGATLLAGADDDFDGVESVCVERIREDGV